MDNTLIYCKYRFDSRLAFEAVINALGFDEVPTESVFTLGGFNFYIVNVPDTFDEDGNVVATAPDGYYVDVVYDRVAIPEVMNQYEVTPLPTGAHTVLGLDYLYEKRYNELQPQAEE